MPLSDQKTAIAVRHVGFEDLGLLQPLLAVRGFQIRYLEAADGLMREELAAADLLIVLGGPIRAYEDDDYLFLREELEALEQRLGLGLPTLGICLGAQLMARASGSRVYPGPAKEIGWAPVKLTAAGKASALGDLGDDVPVLHWHGDTFDFPGGATLLASTDICENQAFSIGQNALGLQFHIEAPVDGIEHWLVGHAVEIASAPGVDVADLRQATNAAAATQDIRGGCLERWLANLDM